MGKCRFCEKEVPKSCTGEIEDHCTWCGGPVAAQPQFSLGVDRFCSETCEKENAKYDEQLDNNNF